MALPLPRTREYLINRARNVVAKKRLGQNFFVDPDGLVRIVEALDANADDQILEIGPGLGFLTDRLRDSGASITAVELDEDMIGRLRAELGKRVEVIHANVLDLDLTTLNAVPNKVVGNIPYQITSPLIAHLFGEIGEPSPWARSIETVVLMVQLEVAQRLVARPGEKSYSHLTMLRQYFFDAEFLFKVPKEDFFPVPKVTSAVVRLKPYRTPPVEVNDTALLRQLLKAGFTSRRKMLKNNLSFLKMSEDEITEIMRACGINAHCRAEELSLVQFAAFSDAIAGDDHK